MNSLQKSYKIRNFNVSPRYPVRIRTTYTQTCSTFWS